MYNNTDFTYTKTPIILSVDPILGPAIGGNEVFIHIEWSEKWMSCEFGSKRVAAKFISSKEVRCISPKFSPGKVPFHLLSRTGIASNSLEYEYIVNPVLTKVVPVSGKRAGGGRIHLIGEHFPKIVGLRCLFNSTSVDAVWHSTTLIDCSVPESYSAGFANVWVAVQNKSGRIITKLSVNSLLYEYVHTPTLRGIFPTHGSKFGGKLLTIFGSNFRHFASSNYDGKHFHLILLICIDALPHLAIVWDKIKPLAALLQENPL